VNPILIPLKILENRKTLNPPPELLVKTFGPNDWEKSPFRLSFLGKQISGLESFEPWKLEPFNKSRITI